MSPCKTVFLPECSLDAPGELSHTPALCNFEVFCWQVKQRSVIGFVMTTLR